MGVFDNLSKFISFCLFSDPIVADEKNWEFDDVSNTYKPHPLEGKTNNNNN